MIIHDRVEKLLWSIALPGFGQILNGDLLKGLLFIALEFLINMKSNLNTVILYSFLGNTEMAVKQANYQWLLFYPCIYMFAMWDAFKCAKGEVSPFSYLPFFITAILGTGGTIYSPILRIQGVLLGPVWVMILSALIGVSSGIYLLRLYFKQSS
jgi:hypothetical protein